MSDLSARTFDLLVIGAGATGAGIAREAALRGLTVALVDRQDLAAGTSSRSSRLIHGGLRYLEHRQFALVRESLAERRALLGLAPHLVRPLQFVFPLYRGDRVARWTLHLGMALYDLLAAGGNVPRHRALSKRRMLAAEPGLRERGLAGGARYWDAQCDDARLTVAVARAAARGGAVVMNHACVTALDRRDGRVTGAVVEDLLTGDRATVAARVTVNATGPWADGIRRLEDPAAAPLLRTTRGAHAMVPRSRVGHHHAVTFLSPVDGRVMFVLPWGDRTYIGTTDTDDPGDPARVAASDEDLTYLLRSANALFPAARLGPADVVATWAGLRPLIEAGAAPGDGSTPGARSREHAIVTGPGGLLTIAGGKLTTWRRMAAELVDRAEGLLGRRPGGRRALRASAATPLPGGGAVDRDALAAAGRARGFDPALTARLADRYGDEAPRLLALLEDAPALAGRLHPDHPAVGAEVVFAVRHEFARRVDDVLFRRLGVAWEAGDGGLGAVAPAARLMGRELGWDGPRLALEAERCEAVIRAVPRGRELSSSRPEGSDRWPSI